MFGEGITTAPEPAAFGDTPTPSDFEVRPYDNEEIVRLAGMGRAPETDPYVILDGPSFEVFQEVAGLPEAKRSLHLDISSPDHPFERDRLVSVGASIVQEFERHTWMRDPEGSDFCITDDQLPAFGDAVGGHRGWLHWGAP